VICQHVMQYLGVPARNENPSNPKERSSLRENDGDTRRYGNFAGRLSAKRESGGGSQAEICERGTTLNSAVEPWTNVATWYSGPIDSE
jgi:hypothetical protein